MVDINNAEDRKVWEPYTGNEIAADNAMFRQETIDFANKHKNTNKGDVQNKDNNVYVSPNWIKYILYNQSPWRHEKLSRNNENDKTDIHTLVWYLSKLDNLLEEIEDTEEIISKKMPISSLKKFMHDAKTKLNQYKELLKSKKQTLLKQNRTKIDDNDIAHLIDLQKKVSQVKWVFKKNNLY